MHRTSIGDLAGEATGEADVLRFILPTRARMDCFDIIVGDPTDLGGDPWNN